MIGGAYVPRQSCTEPERTAAFKLAQFSRKFLTHRMFMPDRLVIINQQFDDKDCVIYGLLAFFSNKMSRPRHELAIRNLLGPSKNGYFVSNVMEKIESFYNVRHAVVASFLPDNASYDLKGLLRAADNTLKKSPLYAGDDPKETAMQIKDAIEHLRPTRFLIVQYWWYQGVSFSHMSVLRKREKHGAWLFVDSLGLEPYPLKTFVKKCHTRQRAFQVIALEKEGEVNLMRAVKVEVED